MPVETPRYKYSLLGSEVFSWLADRQMLDGEADSDVRLVADELVLPELRIARLWHTSASYRVHRESSTALLLLQIEGAMSIECDAWEAPAELSPGDVAILAVGGHSFRFSSGATTARYEVDYDLDGLPQSARDELTVGRIFYAPAREYRDAVAAASNAALNSGMDVKNAGFSDFAAGVRHLTTALLVQALESTSPLPMTPSSALYRSAMRVIAVKATDPEFDVELLAEAVSTSPRNLRHVFARAGASAKAALTAERVRIARTYLAKNASGGSFSQTEIARLSGFRDVRALRRAVTATGEQVPTRREDAAAKEGAGASESVRSAPRRDTASLPNVFTAREDSVQPDPLTSAVGAST
ncbi:helix-turn-helix domain-containing protein [Rathayibacter rathayi]|uniref:HTH araC/xylS-type domain-containing protein n=1 Tax=Rathayibacter rathayi TaxID=33887 RepID=A0ABD6W5K7_RATRA|nr:helix-turn-helix domain-containing protein [Rathayibacter rathayi]PPF10766.1 hypothetical protein C5C04_12845 [Rathayibacter rathayi]PPI00761.1 hypothetical protein C5C43_09990 [Rathayibacter rathayi]PPI07037.1 hypothetical protein C5D23_12460 [Rathayibacter rathayi]